MTRTLSHLNIRPSTQARGSVPPSSAASHQAGLRSLTPPVVTGFYLRQIRRSPFAAQLTKIIEPSAEELREIGDWDTSGEQSNTIMAGLQHKYPETALVLVTDECFAHCRFCFRKRLVGRKTGEIATDHNKIAAYVQTHPGINNVLLSGGDPFVLATDKLEQIVKPLLAVSHLSAIRFGTRALVYHPARFQDSGLFTLFRRIIQAGKVPVLATHVEHFGEISPEMEAQVDALRRAGVHLVSQTVLLKGINDSPEVLAQTFRHLQHCGVYPYYLFQARPVKGATHFQVPFRRGLEIVRAVSGRLNGLQKTFRYVMSHRTGKIEIVGLDAEKRLYLRYHQCKDSRQIGRLFWLPYREGACWLEDLGPGETSNLNTRRAAE